MRSRPRGGRRAWPRAVGPFLLAGLVACGGGGAFEALPRLVEAPQVEGEALATFVLVGDTIAHAMDPESDALADVASLIEGADVFVLNHEGVLQVRPLPSACAAWPRQTLLDADPRSADAFLRAPHVVATLANNHVLDCDGQGLADTRRELEERGILTVGAGEDAARACAPRRFRAGSLDVACLAYLALDVAEMHVGTATAGAATWDGCDGAETVAALKVDGAFVVVALHLHLGPSWTDVTAPEHLALVEEVLAAGADLVVGHGPHVPQGILVRDGRLAFLSLGNFLFAQDAPLADAARDVVVARVAVHARETLVSLAPARLDLDGRPRPADAGRTDRILEALHQLCRAQGTSLVRSGDRAFLRVERPTSSHP